MVESRHKAHLLESMAAQLQRMLGSAIRSCASKENGSSVLHTVPPAVSAPTVVVVLPFDERQGDLFGVTVSAVPASDVFGWSNGIAPESVRQALRREIKRRGYRHRQSFISFAESYGRAANYVAQGPELPHPAPIGALACHCIELSLKAVLLSRSAPPDMIRKFGHNLKQLFDASGLDRSDIDAEAIDYYHDAAREHAFRYRDSSRPYMLEHEQHLLPIMETVFHRCLNEVAPAARRSLAP